MAVFIIGLPLPLRQRLLAVAQRHDVKLGFALTAMDKRGQLVFVPYEAQATTDLEAFCDHCDWDRLKVVILPYVPIGSKLQECLDVIHVNGAQLIHPTVGADGWPATNVQQAQGANFNDDLFDSLCAVLGWSNEVAPSEYFLRSARRLKDYVILGDALDRCDEVHESRHNFLKQSSALLEQFCRRKGQLKQSLESFFASKGIELAQSGGLETIVRLVRGRRQLQKLTSNLHLKDGDATTPQAAPRIYFQHLDKDDQFRLFLLYVGPHSNHEIDKSYEWMH